MPGQQGSTTTTTIAILGTNTVVENALALLLEGEGYSTRLLGASPAGERVELPADVDLVLLAPSLSGDERGAFFAARRAAPRKQRAALPVIALTATGEEVPLDEGALRVPWPIRFERLVREVASALGRTTSTGSFAVDRQEPPRKAL